MSLRQKVVRRVEQRAEEGASTGKIEMLKDWEIEHVSGAEWVVTHDRFNRTDSHYEHVVTYEWRLVPEN